MSYFNNDMEATLKVTLVGDSGCGKSALFYAVQEEQFEELHYPTVFEFCDTTLKLKSGNVQLTMYDTSGAPEYKKLRLRSYVDCDVVAVCYDLSDPQSLRNVSTKWLPELKQYCPNKPFCIVGCKKDLVAGSSRAEMASLSGDSEISSDEDNILEFCQPTASCGAFGVYQCSAKSGRSIVEIFTAAIESQLEEKKAVRRHTLGTPGFSSPKLSFFRRSSNTSVFGKKTKGAGNKPCKIM